METGKSVEDNWSSQIAGMCYQHRPSTTTLPAKYRRYKAAYSHCCPTESCKKHKVAAVQKGEFNYEVLLGIANVVAEAMHEALRDVKLSRRP